MIEYKSPKGGIIAREEDGKVMMNDEYICTIGQLKWMAHNREIILIRALHVIAAGIPYDVAPEPIDLKKESEYVKALFIDFRGGEKYVRYLYRFNGVLWSADSNKDKILVGAKSFFRHPDAYDVRPIHTETPEEAEAWAHEAMVRRYGPYFMDHPFEELKRIDL